jgi:hypothetical protein
MELRRTVDHDSSSIMVIVHSILAIPRRCKKDGRRLRSGYGLKVAAGFTYTHMASPRWRIVDGWFSIMLEKVLTEVTLLS